MDMRQFESETTRPHESLLQRFAPVLLVVALCWGVFVVNNLLLNGRLSQYGIIPRHVSSLAGILWAPFLHASFKHLAANTVPLLVLGGILCARSRREFWGVALCGILLGGGFTWIFARTAAHVGASGLIFCFFGYLASLAVFRRTLGTLALSTVCILGYGGMIRGILPTSAAVSWEGHAAGFVAGLVLAWLSSRLNSPDKEPGTKSTPGIAPFKESRF
jgi:membrane associated rhomboid family serine protease